MSDVYGCSPSRTLLEIGWDVAGLKEHILFCDDNTGNDAQAPITTPSDGGGGGDDDEGEKLINTVVGFQQGSESFASTDDINTSNSSNRDGGDSSASSNSQEVTVFEKFHNQHLQSNVV